jgi:hypothetical protein
LSKSSKIYSQIDNCPNETQKIESTICHDKISELMISEKNISKPTLLEKNPKIKKSKKTDKCKTIEIDLTEIETNNTNIVTIEKRHVCGCEREFNSRQALYAHKKVCKGIDLKSLQIQKLTSEMESIKKTLAELTTNQITNTNTHSNNSTTHTNSHNLTNTNSNNLTNNLTKNTQKIINVYNYVSSNYDNAPHIKMLEKADVDKLLTVDKNIKHTMEELLVFNQSKYVLDKFLGEIIINAYKKEDPEEQQFWTSNIQKLTFIVRQILNKKDKTWLHDKNGTCLTKHIIDPLLKEIKKMLQKYVKELDEDNDKKTLEELEKSQTRGMFAVKIIYEITEKELHKKILRYIAPQFQLEQQNLLIY